MARLKNRISKIEERQNSKNQKLVAMVVLKKGETKDEGIARHFQEHPEDKNAKMVIIDDILRTIEG